MRHQALNAFYLRHARVIVAALALAVVAGWAVFLLVSEATGAKILVGASAAMLPFLSRGAGDVVDRTGSPDPMNTIGTSQADFSDGPYLDGG